MDYFGDNNSKLGQAIISDKNKMDVPEGVQLCGIPILSNFSNAKLLVLKWFISTSVFSKSLVFIAYI